MFPLSIIFYALYILHHVYNFDHKLYQPLLDVESTFVTLKQFFEQKKIANIPTDVKPLIHSI